MGNIITSGFQLTVDQTFSVGDKLTQVVQDLEREEISTELQDEDGKCVADILRSVMHGGLPVDMNIPLKKDAATAGYLGEARRHLLGKNYEEQAQIGGNPGICALRSYYLVAGDTTGRLPEVHYVGLYPESVKQFISKGQKREPALERAIVKERCLSITEQPQTLAIESDRKIILAYGPGRDVNYVQREGSFKDYISLLRKTAGEHEEGRIVVALSIPWPIELGAKMIDAVKEAFGERAIIFVGTSSLRRKGMINVDLVRNVYENILRKAQIVSFNETELHDMHTAVEGDGAHQDIPLAVKLKQLPLEAITVCHSADGAILELGCEPSRVITSKDFVDNPTEFLEETLRLAADGATYAIDSKHLGRRASAAAVRTYSGLVSDRRTEHFRGTFLKTTERMPAGIVAVEAPLVVRPLAPLTGVGAIFDALFLSFLMRD